MTYPAVCVIGYSGNMGKRYTSILDHLNIKWRGYDHITGWPTPSPEFSSYLIATPTNTHHDLIRHLIYCEKPIICEKPVSKNLSELEKLLYDCEKLGTKLQMVSQYDFLVNPTSSGPTIYDYYKHGTDGIYWDCINIIYHAKSSILIQEKSPVWTCIINGHQLSIADMDKAYIAMIKEWLEVPHADYDRIWKAHEKVYQMETPCKKY